MDKAEDTASCVHMDEAEIHFNSFEWRQPITLALFIGIHFYLSLPALGLHCRGAAYQVFVIRIPSVLLYYQVALTACSLVTRLYF